MCAYVDMLIIKLTPTHTGSLNAQRLLTVTSEELPHKVEQLSRELWMRVWSRVSSYESDNSNSTHTQRHLQISTS